MLERPQIQRVLTHPPSARVTALNTGEVVELFDGGWLPLDLDESLPQVRVIVARHAAPPSGKKITVGKRVGEWVYELFITTLPVDGFLVEDALDLYHGRGAFEAVLADEDVEEDPDRWCSYSECGQELWQIACQWVWNLRLSLGKRMQGDELREIEWAPPKEATLLLLAPEPVPEEYGPWQLAGDVGRAHGQIAGEAFVWQEDGKLRCPAGASLWLSEVRQENAFTIAGCLSGLSDRLSTMRSARAVLGHLWPKATALVGSVWSAVSCPSLRLLSISLSFSDRCGGWMWQDARFVASGQPTGDGNMLRCFHCLRLCLRENLLLVRPEPFVRAIAGVGKTGLLAMPGWDHRKCVSVLPVFPLFSPVMNKGDIANKRSFFQKVAYSSE